LRKSRVGWFTLAGGILGFFTGFALAIFTAAQWNLIVSGKPIVSLIPFFIVGFEFTILFSVFGNVIGLLVCARLPDYRGLDLYDPRCSGSHFGLLASCAAGREGELMDFFRKKGGEVKVFA
jgi:molybdopterin-containing oxidoreductase family membrane subunit